MRMRTGTMYHKLMEDWLAIPEISAELRPWVVMKTEENVTDLLPEGWGGTLDYLMYNPDEDLYAIPDLKTQNPMGMKFLGDEPKPEHTIQVSCYHGCYVDKVNLHPDIGICYMPKESDDPTILPRQLRRKAISKTAMWMRLNRIKQRVDEYVAEYDRTGGEIENDALEPMPEPKLSMYWNTTQSVWDIKQGPYWFNRLAGLPEEFVPKQSTNKVGAWTIDGYYIPRKGWEHIEESMVPRPSVEDFRKRQA